MPHGAEEEAGSGASEDFTPTEKPSKDGEDSSEWKPSPDDLRKTSK